MLNRCRIDLLCLQSTALLLAILASTSADAQSRSQQSQFWQIYVTTVSRFDFKEGNRHSNIYAILEIVERCNAIGKPEVAQTIWRRAEEIVNQDAKLQYRRSFFRAALTFPSLDQARRIANQSIDPDEKNELLDTIDLERLRRGEPDALKDYPRIPLDFFKAIEQGRAYVVAGDFEAADKFIQNLDIPHKENDPRGVGAIVYRQMADHFQKQKDLVNAKKYIDKAMAIGGGLYYTGYGVKVKKRSIYGELDKGLERFAKFGQSYGGHMGRQLVQRLLTELIEQNKLKQAKRVTKFLANQKDIDQALQRIAIQEAAQGKMDQAKKTISTIADPNMQVSARLGIAKQLWFSGKSTAAKSALDVEFKAIKQWSSENLKLIRAFGDTVGAMNQTQRMVEIMESSAPNKEKAQFLHWVIRGHHDAFNQKKRDKQNKNRPQ